MKNFLFLGLICICAVSFSFMLDGDKDKKQVSLAIGAQYPSGDLMLKTSNGTETSLDKQMGESGMLVMFSCNTCPFVLAYEDRFPLIEKQCADMGLGFVIVNSNEAKRDNDDSVDEMQAYTKKWDMQAPYLVDTDSKMADLFGAFVTPEVFLFNAKGSLVYKGAIDDNWKDASDISIPYLDLAVQSLEEGGQNLKYKETSARGCSIKRK